MSERAAPAARTLRVLIAAAGAGRRAGLSYPKTLHPVEGKPILARILELVRDLDAAPTVVVGPAGRDAIAACLKQHGLRAQLVVQPEPRGMGDAVLCYAGSPAAAGAEDVLLIWGDLPYLTPATISTLLAAHRAQSAGFSFPTRHATAAYTTVVRDVDGGVVALDETREVGIAQPGPGERDIGVFVFDAQLAFELLRADLPGKRGRATGEHGFLYIVRHLAARGCRVLALPIATERELISLNALADLEPPGDSA